VTVVAVVTKMTVTMSLSGMPPVADATVLAVVMDVTARAWLKARRLVPNFGGI
jgi:hypothetical protein